MRTPFDAPTEWRFVAGGRTATPTPGDMVFAYQEGRLIIDRGNQGPVPRLANFARLPLEHAHFLGLCHGTACYSGEVPAGLVLPDEHVTVDLRRFVMESQDEDLFAMAARSLQILQWEQSHAFCSRCGSPTQDHPRDFAKVCPACAYTQYPRLSPCVIVLVTRGEHLLLACGVNFTRPMYSTLAGFVEPGETLEQAVHREVWEETGIAVKNLQYHSSQPWPFPHSLMVGFTAEYAGGEIMADPSEISDANWFHVSQLPPIPPRGSISRRLIDEYLRGFGDTHTNRGW